MSSTRELFTRYLPTIVMVPAIVGIHYGWRTLQNNEVLVSKDEKRELPILIVRLNNSIFFLQIIFISLFQMANKLTFGSNVENNSTGDAKS